MAVAVLNDVSLCLGASWVLSHLSLQLDGGTTLLVTGHNGAGKTSLLRLLATLVRPQHGTVHLFGEDVCLAPLPALRRRVALMSHAHHFYEALSAQQNLALVARFVGATPERVHALLERCGLAAHAHTPLQRFSAGMKRRLVLARLLLVDGELLLLDEPYAQLDAAGCALLDEILGDWQARNKTLVVVSHEPARLRPRAHAELNLDAGHGSVQHRHNEST